MSGIPSHLIVSLREILADCEQFETNRSLRNLFADQRIAPWRNNLPQADTIAARVESVISYLYDKKHRDGSNALFLMLVVLIDVIKLEDDRHAQLEKVSSQLAKEMGWAIANTSPKKTDQDEIHNIKQQTKAPTSGQFKESGANSSYLASSTNDNIPESKKFDFFVSYNRNDKKWAEWIAWQLEHAGYTTIIQAWDFRPGGNFVVDMQKATTQSERTIAVLSPDYIAAKFTQPEWSAAFALDPTGEKGLLLPIRVLECQTEGLLPQLIYIDLVGLSADDAVEALLNGVMRGRAKPLVSPSFPGSLERREPEFPTSH